MMQAPDANLEWFLSQADALEQELIAQQAEQDLATLDQSLQQMSLAPPHAAQGRAATNPRSDAMQASDVLE